MADFRSARAALQAVYGRKASRKVSALEALYMAQYGCQDATLLLITDSLSLTAPRIAPPTIRVFPAGFGQSNDLPPDQYLPNLRSVSGHDFHPRLRHKTALEASMLQRAREQFAEQLWQQLAKEVQEACGQPTAQGGFVFSESTAKTYRVRGEAIKFAQRRGVNSGASGLLADLTRLFSKSGWQSKPSYALWTSHAAELELHATDLACASKVSDKGWFEAVVSALSRLLGTVAGGSTRVVVFPYVRPISDVGRTIKSANWSRYIL